MCQYNQAINISCRGATWMFIPLFLVLYTWFLWNDALKMYAYNACWLKEYISVQISCCYSRADIQICEIKNMQYSSDRYRNRCEWIGCRILFIQARSLPVCSDVYLGLYSKAIRNMFGQQHRSHFISTYPAHISIHDTEWTHAELKHQ